PETVNAQVKTGINSYKNIFDKDPDGFWLPECGFKPDFDTILSQNEIRYFITSTHGILHADPRPRYGVYAPIYTPEGVAAFGRDFKSSKQVWSADEGYPGDYNYREFYRDIGYDLDYDYVKDYLPLGIRKELGIKYHKITGETENKDLYNPEQARQKAAEHAGNFMFNRQQQIKHLNQFLDRKPIIVAPYDAELFGHWWFEGPQWLEFLFKKIHHDQNDLESITPMQYLKKYPENQISMPSESSWGYKGYHEVWLNGSNDWIYRHLHEAELKMISLAEKNIDLNDKQNILYRALNQMVRELLLAQSSDWAFILKTDTMVEYAEKRTKNHLNNFFKLSHQIENNNINQDYLKQLEDKNNIFSDIDFKIFKKQNFESSVRAQYASI
ncbi:MAG: glycoside hydrolase family 57 protein, partial [Bacillota bacterium]